MINAIIVDDEQHSCKTLSALLEKHCPEIKVLATCMNGAEGLKVIREQNPNLVFLDVEMPRMNGFDLTTKIRADKKLSEMPIILVTALQSREDRERGMDAGANAYIVKNSFDQSNLLEVMGRLT